MSVGWAVFGAMLTAPQVSFVETRLELGTESFDYEMYDVDLDGRCDLLVTTLDDARRSLALYRQRDNAAYPEQPDWQMTVPAEVTSYAVLDMRDEPGLELALMTRTGVFSVSTTRTSLRDNLRREVELPVFPDLPRTGPLTLWPLTADFEGDGREDLVILSDGVLHVLGARPHADDPERLEFAKKASTEARRRPRKEDRGRLSFGGEFSVQMRGATRSFPAQPSSLATFGTFAWFSHLERWRGPAFFDFDSDGKLDRLWDRSDDIEVTLQGDGLSYGEPDFSIRPSDDIGDLSDWDPQLRDVDDDQTFELALSREDDDEHVFLIARMDERGQVGETTARVKLSAMSADFTLVDADRDGLLDLTVLMLDIPTGLTRLTNVRLDVSYQVYRGLPGAKLSRRPVLRIERNYRPEELQRIQETLTFNVKGDYNGDGVGDLLSIQPSGLLELHALSVDGEELTQAETPFAQYQPRWPIQRARPLELTPDAVTDLLLRHPESITLFTSTSENRP